MRERQYVRAFTILEILVVISIIALLAALLQPVFVAAKKAALRTSCQSNLHQIGLAIIAYGVDNEDHFPSATDRYWLDHGGDLGVSDDVPLKEVPNLVDVLLPYGKSEDMFRCPSDVLPEDRIVGEHISGSYPNQFVYNRTSYYFFLPHFFGKSQTRFPASYFPLARDFDPRWHCEYQSPLFPTPAYNFLYADGHAHFESLEAAAYSLKFALGDQA